MLQYKQGEMAFGDRFQYLFGKQSWRFRAGAWSRTVELEAVHRSRCPYSAELLVVPGDRK